MKKLLILICLLCFSGCELIAGAMLIRESWHHANKTGDYAPVKKEESK